jgi:hypothetical protein
MIVGKRKTRGGDVCVWGGEEAELRARLCKCANGRMQRDQPSWAGAEPWIERRRPISRAHPRTGSTRNPTHRNPTHRNPTQRTATHAALSSGHFRFSIFHFRLSTFDPPKRKERQRPSLATWPLCHLDSGSTHLGSGTAAISQIPIQFSSMALIATERDAVQGGLGRRGLGAVAT